MPSPDVKLEQLVEELGRINVPDLVRFLVSVHPASCPLDLAQRALAAVSASGYAMVFDELSPATD